MKKLNMKKYLIGGMIGVFVALAIAIPTTLLLNNQTPAGITSGSTSGANDTTANGTGTTNGTATENTNGTTNANGQATTGNSDTALALDLNAAKEKALAHANLSASDVNFTQANLERDDGRLEYEIDFVANGMEYDYTIDASTGTITEYDVDKVELFD